MSRVIDTTKAEVGFNDAYKKTFEGVGRNTQERAEANKKYRENYDKIDWSIK